jgi:NADH dehydrogenase (ubiquinone) 1 alpha subcomplex subunit 5
LRPLFALRMALRECETFFFGTARRIGGNRPPSASSSDGSVHVLGRGSARLDGSSSAAPANSGRANTFERLNRRVGPSARAAMVVVVVAEDGRTARHTSSHSRYLHYSAMFRLTRPLFQAAVRKTTTGLTGLSVHPDPLPALTRTYEQTLSALAAIPPASVYRQGVEALTKHKLSLVQNAAGDVAKAEAALDEGHIEEALVMAEDELSLVGKMAEWKACVSRVVRSSAVSDIYIDGNPSRRSRCRDSGSTLARRSLASTPSRHSRRAHLRWAAHVHMPTHPSNSPSSRYLSRDGAMPVTAALHPKRRT